MERLITLFPEFGHGLGSGMGRTEIDQLVFFTVLVVGLNHL
jgi:hypothetical protein